MFLVLYVELEEKWTITEYKFDCLGITCVDPFGVQLSVKESSIGQCFSV